MKSKHFWIDEHAVASQGTNKAYNAYCPEPLYGQPLLHVIDYESYINSTSRTFFLENSVHLLKTIIMQRYKEKTRINTKDIEAITELFEDYIND